MLESLGTITFWVGLIGFFDVVVEKRYKTAMAEFVFGFHNLSAARFESGVIDGLLSVFIRDGRLSLRRVWVYSIFATTLCMVFLGALVHMSNAKVGFWQALGATPSRFIGLIGAEPTANQVLPAWVGLAVIPFFALPADYLSIWLTKTFFWRKARRIWSFMFWFVLDVALSLCPIVLVAVVTGQLNLTEFDRSNPLSYVLLIFLGGALLQLPSTIFVSLVQLFTVLLGMLTRFVLIATRLNSYTVLMTRLHEAPFSFIGLLIGTAAAILGAL